MPIPTENRVYHQPPTVQIEKEGRPGPKEPFSGKAGRRGKGERSEGSRGSGEERQKRMRRGRVKVRKKKIEQTEGTLPVFVNLTSSGQTEFGACFLDWGV